MKKNQTSFVGTTVRLLGRYWIPVAVVALLSLTVFAGQPVWAVDGGPDIGQTVPTPTPLAPTATSAPPAESTATPAPPAEPTATPASPAEPTATLASTPANGGGAAAAPVESTAAPVVGNAAVATSTATLSGTVTAVTLNVRQGPGTSNPVIGRLTAGSTVNVLARNADGTWLLVCCTTAGGNGWVSAQYVAPNFSAAEAAGLGVSASLVTTATVTSAVTGTVVAAATPLEGAGTVDVLTLNIRQGPGTANPVVGRFRQGDTFAVQGTNAAGDWYLVCCVPGSQATGWVSAQYATLGAAAAETPAAPAAATETPAADAAATPAAPVEAAPTEVAPESAEATPTPEAPAESADAGSSETASGVADVLW